MEKQKSAGSKMIVACFDLLCIGHHDEYQHILDAFEHSEEVRVALNKCVAASQLFRRLLLRSFRESARLEQSGCTLSRM